MLPSAQLGHPSLFPTNSFVLTSLADPALHPFCFDIVAKTQGGAPSPFIIPLKIKYLSCGSKTVPRYSFTPSQPSAGEGPAAVAKRAFAYNRIRRRRTQPLAAARLSR